MSGAWYILGANCLDPRPPVEGTHAATITQITWNWNAVTDAAGYRWNTTNDYATAMNLGNVLTYTETGLICNTPYTRYVWAYTICDHSSATTLSRSTNCCSSRR